MATKVRPNLARTNPYWIERHRYYELKHFCLQYGSWKKSYLALDSLVKKPMDLANVPKGTDISKPIEKCAEAREEYRDRMKMVEQAALATDPDLYGYILKAVTEGWAYDRLKARLDMPCGKDMYYKLYRKFFYLLHKARG